MAALTAPIISIRPKPLFSGRLKCHSDSELELSPSPRGLVFNAGSHPIVKRHITDETERWLMWHSSGDSIGLATSNNGVHWSESTGEVLKPNSDWWVFDTKRVIPSDVLIMSSDKVKFASSVYWLYYTGFTQEKVQTGDYKSLPGLAISQDGENWARIEGDHHTGALFDAGEENEWDSLFIAGMKVVYHSKMDLRMYYHSFDVESKSYAIGIARSMDGIKWVKLGKILERESNGKFDEGGVRNGHVVRDELNDKYLMAYEGINNDGKTSIGLAESVNGLTGWRRCFNGLPVLDEGVGSPCIVKMDGQDGWRLYYDCEEGIGLAVCEGSEIRRFQKWKGFRV